jgi:hypothetical protein
MKTLGASFLANAPHPTFFDKYLLTARSASLLLSLPGLDMGRWDRADPAADFDSFEVRPSRNAFDAARRASVLLSLVMVVDLHAHDSSSKSRHQPRDGLI